jgi:ankyrin repeat protein
MWAASLGDSAIVRLLLDHEADVAAEDVNGATAAVKSARAGHPKMAAWLRKMMPKEEEPREAAPSR